jgi:hypothetical protein
MKKLLIAFLVIFCSIPCLSQTQEPVYVDGVNVYSKPKIYSNSYDGYLNMRSAPSSSGNIVGMFRNGETPGYVIKQEGNWIKVYYKGDVGYVYKKYTCSTPTVAVTSEVDASWLEGIWSRNGYDALMFFDNGTYKLSTMEDGIEIGTYRLAANAVVVTPVKYWGYDDVVYYEEELEPRSYVIDFEECTVGVMEYVDYLDPAEKAENECEYTTCCDLTRGEFLKEKESVKAALKK